MIAVKNLYKNAFEGRNVRQGKGRCGIGGIASFSRQGHSEFVDELILNNHE